MRREPGQDVRVPGRIQSERFIFAEAAGRHVEPRSVNPQKFPATVLVPQHGRTAGASVRSRVGQEIALALEAQAERQLTYPWRRRLRSDITFVIALVCR